MSNLLKSKFFLGVMVAIVFALGAVASTASAATTTTVNASAFTYSGVMKAGMKGPGISTLQAALNSVNSTTIVVDGSFGPATLAAVKMFQMSHGLTADGVVGPMTGAALASATFGVITVPTSGLCPNGNTLASNCMTPPSGTSTGALCPNGMTLASNCMTSPSGSTSGSLSGGETDINDINVDDADDDTINEGASKAPVAEIEFDVDDADAQLIRADVVFQSTDSNTNPEDRPWNVFDKVYLMDGTTTIASVDAGDEDNWDDADDVGSNDNNDAFSIRFNNVNKTFKEGETATLTVAADISSGVDGSDSGDAEWVVTLDTDGLRFVDGAGLDTFADSSDTATFEIQEAGGDSEFTVDEANASPDSTTLEVNENSSSTQTIAIFNADADEDGGDVKIVDFPIGIKMTVDDGAAAGTANFSDVIDDVYVVIDGTQYTGEYEPDTCDGASATLSTCTAGQTATFTFDDIDDDDIVVAAGEDMDVTVKVKFHSQGSTAIYDNGTTIQAFAQLGDETDGNVEDADSGDEIGDASGNATAQVMTLAGAGLAVDFDDDASDASYANNLGTFEFVMDLTSFGADTDIDPEDFEYTVTSNEGATDGDDTFDLDAENSVEDNGGSYFTLDENENGTFTFTVFIATSAANEADVYQVTLDQIDLSNGANVDSGTTDIDESLSTFVNYQP